LELKNLNKINHAVRSSTFLYSFFLKDRATCSDLIKRINAIASRIEEGLEAFKKINVAHFDVHIKNFSLMHYYKLSSEIQKGDSPKSALSLKRSSLEIANNYNFKFFQTHYS
jgi:hypothetical protein